jgi:hypothetical protein
MRRTDQTARQKSDLETKSAAPGSSRHLFRAVATRARIDACLPLAFRLGRLCRALTWVQVVSGLKGSDREREAVPGWIQLFLDPVLS